MSDAQQSAANANSAASQKFPDRPPGALQPCGPPHWISVKVIDADDKAVTQRPYRLQLTDGRKLDDQLPDEMRHDSIPAGLCDLDLSHFWDDIRQSASSLTNVSIDASPLFEPDPPDFGDDVDQV